MESEEIQSLAFSLPHCCLAKLNFSLQITALTCGDPAGQQRPEAEEDLGLGCPCGHLAPEAGRVPQETQGLAGLGVRPPGLRPLGYQVLLPGPLNDRIAPLSAAPGKDAWGESDVGG